MNRLDATRTCWKVTKLAVVMTMFLPAMPCLSAQEQSSSSVSLIEVPFQFIRNEIVLQVTVNRRGPLNMLLDTDTDPSGIDLATARELGLKLEANGQPATGGGTDVNLVYRTSLPSVVIGDLSAGNISAGAISLTKLSERLGISLQGVLGHSFLKNRIVQIDYPARKVRFFEVSPYPPHAEATPARTIIAFRYNNSVFIENVYVNGQKVRATLDTGSGSAFNLTPRATTMLGLQAEVTAGRLTSSVGYNGEHQGRVGTLKSVRIGAITVESVEVNFWLPGTGHDQKNFEINIGNGFFKDFVVTFDFRRNQVAFERSISSNQ